jgi:hypothetical protein
MRACFKCRTPILAARDVTTISTHRPDATMPQRLALCPECSSRLARWLHRRPARPATPPAEAPAAPVADARPIRLAVPSDAFLKPPTGPAGWRPSPPA